MKEYLNQILNSNIIKVERAVERFNLYRDLLIEWNNKFNLTAITETSEINLKHFIDSLSGLDFISGNVLDVGSGAGFPSLPLAIIRGDLNFTLVDSLNKRVIFLNEVIKRLNLTNVKTIHARAEDLPKTTLYQTVVARAVAPLNILAEYTLPFVKEGGRLIAYKAFELDEELDKAKPAIKILGGKIEYVKEVALFNSDIVRKLVLIKKIGTCPKIYPRSGNKPKLSPLC